MELSPEAASYVGKEELTGRVHRPDGAVAPSPERLNGFWTKNGDQLRTKLVKDVVADIEEYWGVKLPHPTGPVHPGDNPPR